MASTAIAAARAPPPAATSSTTAPTPTMVLSKTTEKKPAAATARLLTAPNVTRNIKTEHHASHDATTLGDDPLPAQLRRILTEVASTGKCPWLSWNGIDIPESPMPAELQQPRSISLLTNPSSAFTLFTSKKAAAPVYKKLRNGIHTHTKRRHHVVENGTFSVAPISNTAAAVVTSAAGGGRKRSLHQYMPRTSSTATFSASSIGSRSGSEVDDSTQYECDSEGTSATTNSEVSMETRRKRRGGVLVGRSSSSPGSSSFHTHGNKNSNTMTLFGPMMLRYKTLREAFNTAIELVLDHSFKYRGGYKLSLAEGRIHATAAGVGAQTSTSSLTTNSNNNSNTETTTTTESMTNGATTPGTEVKPLSPELIFQQRKRRLLAMLGNGNGEASPLYKPSLTSPSDANAATVEGPPFTIQRIAEVLLAPERYYKQTHKLCNCLEKLLLITSPASAFGGSMGGDTSQNGKEELEHDLLGEKRPGNSESEKRQRRFRRRSSSSMSDEDAALKMSAQHGCTLNEGHSGDAGLSTGKQSSTEDYTGQKGDHNKARHYREGESGTAADDHHHHHGSLEEAARASLRAKFDHAGIDPHSPTAADRKNAGSPPPPGLALGSPAMALSPHALARHLVGEHSPPSPRDGTSHPLAFFSAAIENGTPIQALHANHSIHLLQMHHAAALAGVPITNPPLELLINAAAARGTQATGAPACCESDGADLEVEPGRSSASNSDVDSESDDFSLDDSASDRSDGSDSGFEPFTAARVMALNRMQQQQQRMRVGVHFGGGSSLQHHHNGDGLFRPPPADSEYQSGDSIDSTMAEDSCGSDSSLSDINE